MIASTREFIEKRIKFTSSQLDGDCSTLRGNEKEPEFIYLWMSSLPDELFPNDANSSLLRCRKHFAYQKAGRTCDLPTELRGDGKGTFLFGGMCIDSKVSPWILKHTQPKVAAIIEQYGQRLRTHIAAKKRSN